MKLILTFKEQGILKSFDLPEILPSVPLQASLKELEVPEVEMVSAKLEGYKSTFGRKYILQLAQQPDEKFEQLGEDGSFFIKRRRVTGTGEKVTLKDNYASLFRGAMGPSVLRLRCYDQKCDWVDILRLRINIIPKEDRRILMIRMLEALLPVNPFLALSPSLGLSKVKMSSKWRSESVSMRLWSALIEYQTIKWIIDRLEPHLYAIAQSPAIEIRKAPALRKAQSIRHVGPVIIRRIVKNLGNHPRCQVGDLLLPSTRLTPSMDIVAHRVVGTFLRARIKRLVAIQAFLQRQHDFMQHELDEGKEQVRAQKEYYRTSILEQKEVLRGVKMILSRIIGIWRHGPWRDVVKDEYIWNVDISDFSFNANYRYVFSKLGAFEKMRFVWNYHYNDAMTCTRKDEIDNDGQSRWQKNYSYVYEAWAYIELLKAFDRAGFRMMDQYRVQVVSHAIDAFLGQRYNDPVTCYSEDGRLKVELIYGCRIPVKTRGAKGLCHSKPRVEVPLTPDFIIRFTNIGEGGDQEDDYVIVLDAKSDRELQEYNIVQRDNYREYIYRNEDEKPQQVWLIYSGQITGKNDPRAGIEFSELNGKECWSDSEWYEEGRNESPLTHNGSFRWSKNGISKHGKLKSFERSSPFVGHLRCNALTQDVHDNVFDEFVQGQICTARKVLGIED